MAAEDDSNSWLVLLEASLEECCSLQELRSLCRGQTIPETMRLAVWHRLLELSDSPEEEGLDTFNEIFDLPNQSLVREDCTRVVNELDNEEEDKVSVLSDLESLLTHYCKSHNEVYDSHSSWLQILKILLSMKLTKQESYRIFTALQETYIPRRRLVRGNATSLFRLLLLYHEPELCSFLDSNKIAPDLYVCQWLTSLFAASCHIPVCLALWDYYLINSDPFLVFFLSLVLVINAKDDIMALKGEKEKILELICGLPQQMEARDVNDFCSIAVLYSAQTPVSYKRDYHRALFGEGGDVEDCCMLSQALCLPVSVRELLVSCKLLPAYVESPSVSEARALRFFLVDCRPADQYNAGHLPTAFHLDSNLMLTEPQAFSVAVQALLSAQKQSIAAQSAAGGEHLVFFGSGREAEDQYVHMVVAFFLQRHVQFVGLVQGGFQAVHGALAPASNTSQPLGLVDHNPMVCLVCRAASGASMNAIASSQKADSSQKQGPPTTPAAKSDFFDKLRSKSAVVKEKLTNYIVNPSTTPVTNFEDRNDSSSRNAKGTAASSNGAKGKSSRKLYRNLAPIFSIDDDQGDDDDSMFEGVSERLEDTGSHDELVAISTWLKKPEVINSFRCHEVKQNGHTYSSYLLITQTHLYVLREVEDHSGMGRLSVHRLLSSIFKITSKKRQPEFITFRYGVLQGDQTVITDADCFIIPQAGDAVKLVKQQIFTITEGAQVNPSS